MDKEKNMKINLLNPKAVCLVTGDMLGGKFWVCYSNYLIIWSIILRGMEIK
jgi:hypothetical protein